MTLRQSANESVHAETVRDNWAQICDFTDSLHPKGQEASLLLGTVLQELWDKDAARAAAGDAATATPSTTPVVRGSVKSMETRERDYDRMCRRTWR